MENKGTDQLELFSQGDKRRSAVFSNSPSFMRRIRGYERLILTIIAFLITSAISFSLGVEKGRRISGLKNSVSQAGIGLKTRPASPVKPYKQLPVQGVASNKPQKSSISLQNWTIQVATYSSYARAKKEAEILRKKGFTSLILNKGRMCIICVGSFATQEAARPLWIQLKKQYQDCWIRRL
ncbi:MAG: SPOR domain-containing protein [Candidatus Omnitrophota bacterium]